MLWQPLSLSILPFLEGLPGIALGSTSPVSRRLFSQFSQRFMVGIDTEKVLAASSLGTPRSTAESTLTLRSFEYGFMPGDYHIMDRYLRVPLSEEALQHHLCAATCKTLPVAGVLRGERVIKMLKKMPKGIPKIEVAERGRAK